MDGDDPDTRLAYYMFVNYGWRPQQVDSLPDREKILMTLMALKEIKDRPKPKEGRVYGGNS